MSTREDDPRMTIDQAHRVIAVVGGFFIGGLIGFLFRPSGALVGQLPLTVVFTRGENLSGLDKILLPLAQTSFNYLVGGGVIGMVVGYLVHKFSGKK